MAKKINIRELGIISSPVIKYNETMNDKIMDEILKRTGMFKNKLNIIKKDSKLYLRFNNVDLLELTIDGDSKSGFYITLE